MALKTAPEKSETSTPVSDDTVLLELNLYTIYTWQDCTYEKGKAYRFKRAEAMALLAESDAGRPVWRFHRPSKPKATPQTAVIDATKVEVKPLEPIHGVENRPHRIDVGQESEIQELLNRDGDVTI